MNRRSILKAEAVLGVLLLTRHRAPPLAALLSTAAVIVVSKTAVPVVHGGISPALTAIGAAIAQGAVAGSRLATPAALACARAAAAPAYTLVLGRLVGTAILLVPVLFVQAVATVPAGAVGWLLADTIGLALITSAMTLSLIRWSGASVGAVLGGCGGLLGFVMIGGQGAVARASAGLAGQLGANTGVSAAGVTILLAGSMCAAVLSLRKRPVRLRDPASGRPALHRWIGHARPR